MSLLKFKKVNRDRLYFDRFEYSIAFELTEVTALRSLNPEEINETIRRRRVWREVSRQRWLTNNHKLGTIMRHRDKEITDEVVAKLHDLAKILRNTETDFKFVINIDRGCVYTNDLNFLQKLDGLDYLLDKSYCRAQITRARDTIELKDPKHPYRSYFKSTRITHQQAFYLSNFLSNHQENIRVSPALTQWSAFPHTRLHDYFFVDHDSFSWLTMLNLVHPGLIRKTMTIVGAK